MASALKFLTSYIKKIKNKRRFYWSSRDKYTDECHLIIHAGHQRIIKTGGTEVKSADTIRTILKAYVTVFLKDAYQKLTTNRILYCDTPIVNSTKTRNEMINKYRNKTYTRSKNNAFDTKKIVTAIKSNKQTNKNPKRKIHLT